MSADEDTLASIAAAVMEGSEEDTVSLCRRGLSEGIPPAGIIRDGLSRGMRQAGELYNKHRYFLPELLVASEAMHAGMRELVPSLLSPEAASDRDAVVLGVVEGDVHEIGKNLVAVLLRAEGHRVIDLGYDVAPERFIAELDGSGARVLALSTMMTTTIPAMRRTVELARAMSPRPLIIVGGAPLSAAVAEGMGADGYEDSAAGVPALVKSLRA